MKEKERQTGQRHAGILTDGRDFRAYQLIDGELALNVTHRPSVDKPRNTLIWLDSVLCLQPTLQPEPHLIRAELGGESMAWWVANRRLSQLWSELRDHPECRLKRGLWASLLARVYGADVDDDNLFFQHTYLSIVSKSIALHVLGLPLPSAQHLLEGTPFVQAGISGMIESDFFDWVMLAPSGADFVNDIARQTGRFQFASVRTDVLKELYESLIDPSTRHELGEYYTPDWLADRVCRRAIDEPLDQKVLDPSCGSGTFLFHAIRLFFEASERVGMPNRQAISLVTERVFGIDIHPVAVQIARVTYLLAIGVDRLSDRDNFAIPVYLGDSLQWNTTETFMGTGGSIIIAEPEDPAQPLRTRGQMSFPIDAVVQPEVFDQVLHTMVEYGERQAEPGSFDAWLQRETSFDETERRELVETYQTLSRLHAEGRNHIWAFVARNQARPAWLSQATMRPDRVVGNPPWLSYRFMTGDLQERFKREATDKRLWIGGRFATQQDLAAYFVARCLQLYGRDTSKFAFVLPLALATGQTHAGFRTGDFRDIVVEFTEAWLFPNLQPLFPVPSCVLFGSWGRSTARNERLAFEAEGRLRTRDASAADVEEALDWVEVDWPGERGEQIGSIYRTRFKQGATLVPRMLAVVNPVSVGQLGGNRDSPLVQSKKNALEKKPWRDLPALKRNVEARFLAPLLLGESIAPYRILSTELAVIPWDGSDLLDARKAQSKGYVHLAGWMDEAEATWEDHKSATTKLNLVEQFDYFGKLQSQFPIADLRVAYSKAGAQPAATIVRGSEVVDHKLYWASIANLFEGYFLCAVLNSDTARELTERLQSRGLFGPRDFDKVIWTLPIPDFDSGVGLHRQLSELGQEAERIANELPVAGVHFVRARQEIRRALSNSGVAEAIEKAVTDLLARKQR